LKLARYLLGVQIGANKLLSVTCPGPNSSPHAPKKDNLNELAWLYKFF
jgi:hypothetical protein